jgi:hypothetical protein
MHTGLKLSLLKAIQAYVILMFSDVEAYFNSGLLMYTVHEMLTTRPLLKFGIAFKADLSPTKKMTYSIECPSIPSEPWQLRESPENLTNMILTWPIFEMKSTTRRRLTRSLYNDRSFFKRNSARAWKQSRRGPSCTRICRHHGAIVYKPTQADKLRALPRQKVKCER